MKMKKLALPRALLLGLSLALWLGGCASGVGEGRAQPAGPETSADEALADAQAAFREEARAAGLLVPDALTEVPEEYFAPAARPGSLSDLYYETYESFSYADKGQKLEKHAVVYLPPDYSEARRYDVFYMMHGAQGDENSTLGTPDRPTALKHVLDHMIGGGLLRPLIVVCPTYNNTNAQGLDSDDIPLSLRLTKNFHRELINDLIPAVEGRFSSFATDTSAAALRASRAHRAFGGFSMGAVTTWRIFENGLDYFRCFFPMSCAHELEEEEIQRAAEGRAATDFFVLMMTGTEDFAYACEERRAMLLRANPLFVESGAGQRGNFAYRVKEGYGHDGAAVVAYLYNGLPLFFPAEGGAADTSGLRAL